MKQIPIFFTFDRYYAVPAAVAFYSLLRHAAPLYQYNLYVLHTSIPQAIQKRLARLIKRFPNANLQFIDVSHFDGQGDIGQGKSHFSKEIYYKLIAAEIFPQYDRILCSDVDVVFTGDISPSYFLFPDEDFYYAGVGQVLESGRMKAYADDLFSPQEKQALEQEIMAGYLLFNLAAIRRDRMQEKLTDFSRLPGAVLPGARALPAHGVRGVQHLLQAFLSRRPPLLHSKPLASRGRGRKAGHVHPGLGSPRASALRGAAEAMEQPASAKARPMVCLLARGWPHRLLPAHAARLHPPTPRTV